MEESSNYKGRGKASIERMFENKSNKVNSLGRIAQGPFFCVWKKMKTPILIERL